MTAFKNRVSAFQFDLDNLRRQLQQNEFVLSFLIRDNTDDEITRIRKNENRSLKCDIEKLKIQIKLERRKKWTK